MINDKSERTGSNYYFVDDVNSSPKKRMKSAVADKSVGLAP